jgi:hypothetical protein
MRRKYKRKERGRDKRRCRHYRSLSSSSVSLGHWAAPPPRTAGLLVHWQCCRCHHHIHNAGEFYEACAGLVSVVLLIGCFIVMQFDGCGGRDVAVM